VKQTYVSQWPALSVRIKPETFARIEAQSEQQGVPMTTIVRVALDRAFGSRPQRLSELTDVRRWSEDVPAS
jgi:hypothetical protein